ncbi:MAG: tryptophan 7-halogenase, partial [Novosphingobium sp.]
MIGSVQQVVIVGGGTAGWLSACLLAARRPELAIALVEAPDIPTIGVGEGTWPTMRETLATIGIPEAEFLSQCDASFKQGSRFDGWVDGSEADSYYHPFTPPPPGDMAAMLAAWQADAAELSFAATMTPQALACDENLSPRQRAMPDYAGALNYGYHLDAGKFAALLKR